MKKRVYDVLWGDHKFKRNLLQIRKAEAAGDTDRLDRLLRARQQAARAIYLKRRQDSTTAC